MTTEYAMADVYENGCVVLQREDGSTRALPVAEDRRTHRCTVCGKPSIYVWHLDRLFHEDGSDMNACWLSMLRGAEPRYPLEVTRMTPEGEPITTEPLSL